MALGSVSNAAPATVLPFSLCVSFSEGLEVQERGLEYRDGTLERSRLVETTRRRFSQAKRLTVDQMDDLREFWDARKGPLEPFYFYHCKEGAHDPTGVATAGRYTVRFDGDWSEQWGMARGDVSISIVEIA
jgi:hypothetical protein